MTILQQQRTGDRVLEAKLSRLERTLLKETKHLRDHHDEMADIAALYKAKKIDRDHAEYLQEKSRQKYADKEYLNKQAKVKDRLKPKQYLPSDPVFNPDMSLPWYKRWFAWED